MYPLVVSVKEEKEDYSVTSMRLLPDINLTFVKPMPVAVFIDTLLLLLLLPLLSAVDMLYDAEILNRLRSYTPLRDMVAKKDNWMVECGGKTMSTILVLFSQRNPRCVGNSALMATWEPAELVVAPPAAVSAGSVGNIYKKGRYVSVLAVWER